jgi:hypothetical protein
MTRHLLLAAALITVASACTASGTPAPAPDAVPSGITSQDAARIGPLAPAKLTAMVDTGNVRLAWPATGEDIAYYQCLRRAASTGQWQPVGRTPPDQHTFLDADPGNGTYVYGVQAVKASGLASPITESQPVTIS